MNQFRKNWNEYLKGELFKGSIYHSHNRHNSSLWLAFQERIWQFNFATVWEKGDVKIVYI